MLVRHGESTGNAAGRFTGWRDADLTDRGRQQASAAGALLAARGFTFTAVFTSMLRRAIATADLMLAALGHPDLPRQERWRLNERHCGAMHGLTKAETYARYGEEQGRVYRRSWDIAPPPASVGGEDDPRVDPRYRQWRDELPLSESMGDLWRRVDRVWREDVAPLCAAGGRVLVVGHGMALRAFARSVEGLAAPELPPWKLGSAAPRCYELGPATKVLSVVDLMNAGDVPEE